MFDHGELAETEVLLFAFDPPPPNRDIPSSPYPRSSLNLEADEEPNLPSGMSYGFRLFAGLEFCEVELKFDDPVAGLPGVGLPALAPPQSLCFSRSCAVLLPPVEGGGLMSLVNGLVVVADCENCVW